MEKIKLLVLDDKRIIGDLFEFTLGYGGHTIKCVHSAQEALDAVQKEHFDIAFIDIVMPDKDGVAVLKELKSANANLPIVMMSGYSVLDKREEASRSGASACLNKPFEMDDVRRIVKDVLGKEI